MCLAVPGKIVEIIQTSGLPMARINFGGVTREACIVAISEAAIGDYVIVHAGFALNRMSEAEAFETLAALKEIAELDDSNEPLA